MRFMAAAVGVAVVSGDPGSMGCNGFETEPVALVWDVPEGPGSSGVSFIGCSDVDVVGNTAQVRVGYGACWAQGWRKDGQLVYRSFLHDLTGPDAAGNPHFGMLQGPIGGTGFELRQSWGGVRVVRVLPGLPAANAGLHSGDWITAVNDRPTHGMASWEVLANLLGPPGTEVELTIDRQGETHMLQMERVRIP